MEELREVDRLYTRYKELHCINKIVLFFVYIFFIIAPAHAVSAKTVEDCFIIADWDVGQFAEYRVIGFDDMGIENSYRLTIIGKEMFEGEKCFWLRYDIINRDINEITFRALVSPITAYEFSLDPAGYIEGGALAILRCSKKLFVSFQGSRETEVEVSELFVNTLLENDSCYTDVPDEKEAVDFSRLTWDCAATSISTPAGVIDECYGFRVTTRLDDPEWDTGMDFFRSANVPFLGIVRIEFSKTRFREKLQFQQDISERNCSWFERLWTHIFVRPVKRMWLEDTWYCIELIDFGIEENLGEVNDHKKNTMHSNDTLN
ncbi:MAG: hypothetical protein V1739_09775 [Candidatus Omnitrophota bacterium]